MKCAKCGRDNSVGEALCKKCGATLDDDIFGETIADASLSDPSKTMPISENLHDGVTSHRSSSQSQQSKTAGSPMDVPTQHVPTPARSTPPPPERSGTGRRTSDSQPSQITGTGAIPLNTVLGTRYEILELLGEGGMGRVYKAMDLELDKIVALKTVRIDRDGELDLLQRVKQELLLARKITHKNVIRIYDMGEAEGNKFFTMEYIEGESLKDLIRKKGKISFEEAIPMVRQILSALEEAHNEGVIHRDLKPQNIVIDKSGTPHIMDFGIARSAQDTTGMTATGAVIGTPDYMSPEQVKGEKAEAQADLFAFGVFLYEMLTGHLPYKADTPISKVMMRLTHKPRAPREVSADIPKYLEAIVLKSMEVDLDLRYKSARQILDDLDREQVDRSFSLKVQKAVAQRKWGLIAAAAVVVVVAVAYFTVGEDSTAPNVPAGPAENLPVTTVAILPFTNTTGSQELDWMRTGLPEMLVTDISQSQFVRPIPGERVLKVMHELGIAEHTRFDEAALDALSERASAQSVLYGQFLESGGNLRLDLTLRKAGTGVPIPFQVEAPSSDVFTIVDGITGRVKSELDLTPEQLKGDTDRPIAEVSSASLEALRMYQSGLANLNRGENQAAIEQLKESTRRDPDFAMAFAKLADAYMNAGDYREAEAAIDRAKSLSDRSPLPLAERYQIHATAAEVKDDLETATKSYQELSKLYPNDPDILLKLASLYEGSGMIPEAIDTYGRVVKLAPDYGEAHFGLAWVQLMSGNAEIAITSLQDILAKGQFKDEPEAMGMVHSILGVAYRETAEPDKALENFGLSLKYREQAGDLGGQATTLANMAQVFVNLDQTGKGLDALGKALAIAREMGDREGESDFQLEIGRALESEEDLDKAVAAYRKSLQIEMERQDHTNLANRLDHIANIYRLKGQYDDALVYLEQAKTHLEQSEEKREQAINLNYIGLVKKAQGLYDEALESFLAALPLFKEISYVMGVVETQRNSAEIYRSQGRYADAYTSLQQQHQLVHDEIPTEHEIADAKAPLGRLLVTLGRLEEAEKELHDAEQAAGDGHTGLSGPEILLGQAQLANSRGQQDVAAEAFKEANIQANLSGRKEIAVESRIELGRLYLKQGKLPNAERLLSRTRQEAAQARLRPLEAEAAEALAEVYLIQGDAEAARAGALESISMADKFSGRPVLYRAYASLGQAYQSLGRSEEALDAYANAASTLEWIRGGLLSEHVDSFMARTDVQGFLKKVVPFLEKGGRTAEAAPLKKWIGTSQSGS